MYVGVDLSHGPAGSSRRHSTVAVVASVGDIPSRYLKEIYVQDRPPEADGESWETVVKMKDIMKSLICQYKEHQGYPPSAIIIYRDGISTSEFDTVFEKELTAIREACVELSGAYRPYLTYIVVNKRHHTRFYPTGSDENVEAGTLNDSPDVTNPITYSFYLNSHYVNKEKVYKIIFFSSLHYLFIHL
jgi:eukaryotic translation initiation factor 2C